MAHMPDFEADIKREMERLTHHGRHEHGHALATQTPAPQPANPATAPATARTTQEDRMSLITLEDDLKTDFTDGIDWFAGFAQRLQAKAPDILETAETLAGSTVKAVIDAVGGRTLEPELETILADIVKSFMDRNSKGTATAAQAGTGTGESNPYPADPQQAAAQAGTPVAGYQVPGQ